MSDIELRDPVFKGCTRPPMLAGVPLMPFIVTVALSFIPAMWILPFSPVAGVAWMGSLIPVVVVMRQISRSDDQRLAQMLARLTLHLRQRNAGSWRAHSYAATRTRKWR
jgi:type IV secretory pathway VirB3-like protein